MTPSPTPRRGLQALSTLALAALLAACASGPTPVAETAAPSDRNALPRSFGSLALSNTPEATAVPSPATSQDEALGAPELEDSLRPGMKIDLDAPTARNDLWDRLRAGFQLEDLDNEGVRRAEAWYSARPDYVQRMTERGSRYLFHIIEEVEKRGMPAELALLPFTESAFNPQAMSTAKASGMWQFVPATGRDFSLKQNIFRDDRRDVLASTRAALDYLGRLHKMFGDWRLALAAYNWGQGNVQKAIARNQKAGLPTDYESLRMPEETRYYIPKLQAVKNIVQNPEKYGLSLPPVENHPYFLTVRIDRDIDLETAARLAGITLEKFKQFNPQMNKPVMLAAGSNQLLLPYDNAKAFALNLSAHRGPLASWTAWVVPKTMHPSVAAKQVGMDEDQLREVNKIPPRMLVKQGSTLLVPRSAKRSEDVSSHLADNASISLAPDVPPLRKLKIKAGRNDSVTTVAARYGVSPAQVAQWNKVTSGAKFKPGQALAVYVPNKPAARSSTQVAAKSGKAGASSKGGTRVASAKSSGKSNGSAARSQSKPRGVTVAAAPETAVRASIKR
ncbi:transglycosylase SLT domain-containing protein [Kinneretia aquatilis]|uniref:transglycosylase SLT domain-containing protein n=1 Tax=Kinneretia aquatilis TaxID=2070761 RepID=UPI001495416B|nr:transglycosylase SLT domain-containing protein [Paucibacter aquatile]WIV99454.1 transglycosylase SLT domain-containing protein [Paucibacter aquatile]